MAVHLQQNTRVYDPAGQPIGRLDRVVYHPRGGRVTHLVVKGGFAGSERKVVPFEWVDESAADEIHLRTMTATLDELPDFEHTHYVVTSEHELLEGEATQDNAPAGAATGLYYYPPALGFGPTFADIAFSPVNMGAPQIPVTGGEFESGVTERIDRNIPEGTVPLREDADVISSDGKTVGDVERVIVDTRTGKTTHFLISRGLLFKSEKLVPQDWIERVEEDRIYLAVDSGVLNRLPDYAQ